MHKANAGNPWGRKGQPSVPLTRARQRLAAKHFSLVEKVFCKYFYRVGMAHRDDFHSNGCLGLVRSAASWDPALNRNGKAGPYLVWGIRAYMRNTIQWLNTGRRRWGNTNIDEFQLLGIPSATPTPLAIAIRHEVAEMADRLPPPMRALLRWRFWDGLTLREIGQRIGRTKEIARQRCDQAVAALRKGFEDD